MKGFKTYLFSLTMISLVAVSFSPSAAAMDRVRTETHVDDAAAKYGVTGSNTLVAIFDRGIDWTHPDFRNSDGTTRIEFIFDLTDDLGATNADNPYGMGTIYTKAQIDGALQNGTNLVTRDAVGHGTTTAGIACGGGQLMPRYRGVAPGSRIIVVKITSDGAPAHNGEPEELPFNHPERISVAIDFTTNKAAALGLPCVMLYNVGSVGGPTDGTSAQCRKVNDTVGAGKPGLAFVTGTSDDGGAPNRAGGIVASGETASLQIEKVDTNSLVCDLWYSEVDRFDVAIMTPSGTFGPYTAPATETDFDSETTPDFFYYHLGANVESWGATSPKREIYVRLDGPAGTYQIELTGTTVTSGRFDATLNPSRLDPSNAPINRFLNFLSPGSIWDLGTASNNICPNSYVILTNYTDIDHFPCTVANEGPIGGLWNSSGVGPTFDGRLGVDISAPGNSLFTTYNPRSYWATFRFNLIEGGNTNYGRAGAVSAASPIITGIIALMLEMDPTLDAARIKHILQATARTDTFTGATPNPMWGCGKVDALAALDLVHTATPAALADDFDGDSLDDFALYTASAGEWHLKLSSYNYVTVQYPTGFGSDAYVPLAGDFDGDDRADFVIYSADACRWVFLLSGSGYQLFTLDAFGGTNYTAVCGDFDGDGLADPALYQASTGNWRLLISGWQYTEIDFPTGFGDSGYDALAGDFDGDSRADFVVYETAGGTWQIKPSQYGYGTYDLSGILLGGAFGGNGMTALAGDFDGDNKADFGSYQSGQWTLRLSRYGYAFYTLSFGVE